MAPPFIYVRNDALETNPPVGDQFLTVNGSNWLYTVTAIYGFSLVSVASWDTKMKQLILTSPS